MFYITIIALLLTPIAIIAGGVYAYRKLPGYLFLLLVILAMAMPIAVFTNYERRFMLSFAPDALEVHSIGYREEESWGRFGPGGNEAGIRVYPLPDKIARQVSEQGLEFLDNLPPNQDQGSRRWRGYYGEWSETPIKPGNAGSKTRKLGASTFTTTFVLMASVLTSSPPLSTKRIRS